jgi:hypothetical protein
VCAGGRGGAKKKASEDWKEQKGEAGKSKKGNEVSKSTVYGAGVRLLYVI